MKPRLTLAGVIALAAALLVARVVASSQQAPVFRGGVDRVAVDFVAVAADGRPVPNLATSDLVLKVDGKAREIKSLQFVELIPANAPAPTRESGLTPAEALPSPFGSNAPADAGRAVIFVFHHTSMSPGDERPAKAAATAFIRTLNARDRVALVTYMEGGVVVDLTTNHARVIEALSKVTGTKPKLAPGTPVATDAASRNEEAFGVKNLVGLMNSFSSIDGPKTVIFVSGGLPGLSGADFKSMDRANDFRDVGRAAAKAHAQIFAMLVHSLGGIDAAVRDMVADANGLSNSGFKSAVGDGLQDLAGVTGGEFFQQSASAKSAFDRLSLESSAYYLLSFDAETRERDGKYHKISVTTSRPGLLVRSRPEFLIDKPGTTAAAPAKTQTRALLGDLLTYRDLPLRAVAYPFRAPDGKTTVIVAADSEPGTKIAAASYALIDEKGKVIGAWDADAADLASTPVVSATTITPGTYRLRVAAAGADGRLGAVDYEFKADVTDAGPLKTAGLMLGRMEDTKFTPQIDFSDEDGAVAYVEVYGTVPSDRKASVTIEVAPAADLPAVLTAPGAITDTRDDDRWIATATLPLTKLAPGDYVVRAILKVGDQSGTIVRTLRKRAR